MSMCCVLLTDEAWLSLALLADLWTHHVSPAEISRRWPEMTDYDDPSGGASEFERNRTAGGQPAQCQLAVSALLRGGGRHGPGLTPDGSCIPPRALCHYLPRGLCTPARLDERVHAVVQASRSYGLRPKQGFGGLFALRCVHTKCRTSKPQFAEVGSAPKKQRARVEAAEAANTTAKMGRRKSVVARAMGGTTKHQLSTNHTDLRPKRVVG